MLNSSAAEQGTRVSVIVTGSAALSAREECLTSLLNQDAPARDVEVLVVTDHSDDGFAELIAQLTLQYPDHRLHVIPAVSESVGAARNLGLEHALGDHIMFVDADDWVSPDAISCLVSCADGMNVPTASIIEGSAKPSAPDGQAAEDVLQNASGDLVSICTSTTAVQTCAGMLFPRRWLADVRFDETLTRDLDLVFIARAFGPFARRFAQLNLAPMRAGARYHRRAPRQPASGRDGSYEEEVSPRIDVLRALASGLDADPRDRTQLTEVLIQQYAARLVRVLGEHSELGARAARDLAQTGIRGVDLSAVTPSRWPGYATVMGQPAPPHAQRVALVSGTPNDVVDRRAQIAFLSEHGLEFASVFLAGPLGAKFPEIPSRRLTIVHEKPTRSRRGVQTGLRSMLNRVDRAGRRGARRVALRTLPLATAARLANPADRTTQAFLSESIVVALDETGEALAHRLGHQPEPAEWLDGQVLAVAAVAARISAPDARVISGAANALAALPGDSPHLPPPEVWTLAGLRLIRNARRTVARHVLGAAVKAHLDAAAAHGWDLLRLLADVLDHGQLAADYGPICQAVMAEADRVMDGGASAHSLFLIEHTIELLFHPEAQANVSDPPLVRTPDDVLAPLAGSTTWQGLTAPVPGESRPTATATATATALGGATRRAPVLILPGAYPKFVTPICQALDGYADTEVLRLTDVAKQFGSTGPSLSLLAQRHAAALGETIDVSGDISEAFAGRDVIFADWADKGAMLASLFAPPGARLVVRFHGVDSLSVWQFLIDWSRVTDVVFVSDHLRRVVLNHLGGPLASVRQHVMGNAVDVARFGSESTSAAGRTLGLVGWGQRVKDPLWALEVLAELRADDPQWHLKLIGADFPARPGRTSERSYAAAFRDRAHQSDIRSAITYVGYTRDLPTHLAGVGFALSSSLRESWHIGVMEMIAAQAVPVIRDWPVYRDHGGAGSLVPRDWIVQTPREAAARIRAHADSDTWRAAANAARQHVVERFDSETAAADYRRIILG